MVSAAARLARLAARVLAIAGLGLLLCLAVATVADGLLRYLLGRPIDAVRDLGGMVAAVSVAACVPAVLQERGNITIRFVASLFGARAGRIADAAAALLVEAILVGIAWRFFRHARQAGHDGISTWMLHLPTAPFWWAVDAIFWVAVAVQAVVALELIQAPQRPVAD